MRASKLKMGRVTLTTPLLGWFVILKQNLTILASAITEISLGRKILNGSCDPNHGCHLGKIEKLLKI